MTASQEAVVQRCILRVGDDESNVVCLMEAFVGFYHLVREVQFVENSGCCDPFQNERNQYARSTSNIEYVVSRFQAAEVENRRSKSLPCLS